MQKNGKPGTIGTLLKPRREKAVPAEHPDLSYIGLEHVQAHTSKLLGSVPATEMRSTANRFYTGDVLYSRLRPYLNKVWRADRDGLCSSEFIVLPGNDEIDANFLRYRLNSADFVSFANSLNAGDRPRVDFDQISSFCLPNFSLDAQRAAVAEIEKQFTLLEAGVSALRRVQVKLKRYRAAVLKAACEGKLVPTEAELSRSQPSTKNSQRNYESGEQLLQRILTERRKNWQGRRQYQEPAAHAAENLPKLPPDWTWASLDQLLGLMRNGISAKPDAESGLPILRISAVRALSVNLAESRYLNAEASDYPDYALSEGDLLFTRYNGNPELVGVCGVVPALTSPLVHPDKLIRCKLVPSGALPDFVAIMANAGESRSYLAKRVRTTAGQAGISGSDLKGLPIPLAPLTQQTAIVAEVERRLSVVEELNAALSANLQRATRLRQTILTRVFTESKPR
ncbi:MAG: hypothetical protein ACR2NX_10220 [Chthoniobacterales bacterium]